MINNIFKPLKLKDGKLRKRKKKKKKG